jgi:hypothetical protein
MRRMPATSSGKSRAIRTQLPARVAAAKALLDDAKRTKPTVDNPEGEPDDPISKRAVEILSDLRRGKAN